MEVIVTLGIIAKWLIVPMVIYGIYEDIFLRTKIGKRFEDWLFKVLGL